jgi:hypothetical protein
MQKPGHKTTELLVTLLVSVGALVAAIGEWLPPKYAALAATVAAAAYSLSRGLAKLTLPPPAGSPPAKPSP